MKVIHAFLLAVLTVQGFAINSAVGQPGTTTPQIVSPDAAANGNSVVNGSSNYFEPNYVNGNGGIASRLGGRLNGRAGGRGYGNGETPASWTNERGRIYSNALFMTRKRAGNFNLVQTAGGAPLLRASQFDFDYEPGFELGLRHRIGPLMEIDAKYMHLDNMNADPIVTPVNNGDSFNTNPPSPVNNSGTTFNDISTYGSDLHSSEINFLRQFSSNSKIGIGFRMFQLSEQFTYRFAPNFMNLERWDTENFMFGGQLVGETLLLLTDRVRIDGFGKGGLYGNVATRETSQMGNPGLGAFTPNPQILEDTDLSFMAESGIRISGRVTRCMAINAGYSYMFFNGVALAPDQVPNTNSRAANYAPLTLDMSNTYYRGAFFGLEFRR